MITVMDPWWWLDFFDANNEGDGADKGPKGQPAILGYAVVKAPNMYAAVKVAHEKGCNPGGMVQMSEIDSEINVPKEWTNRLLTRAECRALNALLYENCQN